MIVTLLQGVTAANSRPTAATDGVPLWRGNGGFLNAEEGLLRDTHEAALLIWNTAGTGAISIAYAKLWAYINSIWTPLGTGVAADKGKLNYHDVSGTATYTIASVVNDVLRHTERVRGFKEATRMALELSTFTGTFTVKAQLIASGIGPAVS